MNRRGGEGEKGDAKYQKTTFDDDGSGDGFFAAHDAGDGAPSKRRQSSAAAIGEADHMIKIRRETAVPMPFVIGRLKHSIESSELGGDLLIFIPFLILFIFFFLAGRDVEANYFVLKGIRDQMMLTEYPNVGTQLATFQSQVLAEERIWVELDKRYNDIGNSGDWSDWVNDVVVPTTWDCLNPTASHQLLAPLGQNYHIGAMRFRSMRMPDDSCNVDSDIYPANASKFPQFCYGKHKRKKEQTSQHCNHTNPITNETMFKYKKCSEVPGVPITAVEGYYHCGGHMFEIPFNATCQQAAALAFLATDYSGCGFIDSWATRFVVIEYHVYTPSTDTFHSIKLFTEILAGGSFFNQFHFRSYKVYSQSQVGQLILDFFFFIYVCYYWIAFFYDMVMYKRANDNCLGFFTEFWNILEFVNLVTFIAVFIMRWMWLSTSQSSDNIKFPFPDSYPDNLDKLMALFTTQIYANSVNTILTFLKLLKYVRLNARLNVLTRTIAACQQSIFGVLVLFVFVILGYGITAWTLFGINIYGFRNLGVSMSTLVRILVGDMDYEEMRKENRFLAGAFFWTFVILALFLLLNFLIAIISEAFAKVSGKAYSQDFDETLLRYWQHLKAYFQAKNIKRICAGGCNGKGEKKMLKLTVASLEAAEEREKETARAARDERIAERRAAAGEIENLELDSELEEEIVITMSRADWKRFLDEEVYEALGDIFFDYTWDDIMNDYDDARKSSDEVDKRHMYETVQTGVEKVIGDEMKKVEYFDDILTALETEVGRILEVLGDKK